MVRVCACARVRVWMVRVWMVRVWMVRVCACG